MIDFVPNQLTTPQEEHITWCAEARMSLLFGSFWPCLCRVVALGYHNPPILKGHGLFEKKAPSKESEFVFGIFCGGLWWVTFMQRTSPNVHDSAMSPPRTKKKIPT